VGDYAVIRRTGSTRTVEYLLKDRLGSVDAVANSTGTITETRGYDAFGKPRDGSWNDLTPAKIASTAVTPKGFTQHEHLNQLELIHMNGRAYDYHLGRFTGVDPFIQFPLNSQSLNPYSYILNNPLSGTDPTGYASCSTNATAGECAAAAGSGGTVKVTAQQAGSHIKTTVGSVTNNGDGSATVTNSSTQLSVKITNVSNGGDRSQGVTGPGTRQDQAGSASDKGGQRAREENSTGGENDLLGGARLESRSQGFNDAGGWTENRPEELDVLMNKYSVLKNWMDYLWRKSFKGVGGYRSEYGFVAFENHNGKELRIIELVAQLRPAMNDAGYKELDLSTLGIKMKQRGVNDWAVRLVFHAHPFDRCRVFCSENEGHFGPGYKDQKFARDTANSPEQNWRGAYHVVRELSGDEVTRDLKYVDLYYGPVARR
jgi:RHS repeat-associated protein